MDPVESKAGTDPLFPMTDEQKSTARIARAALNKLKKKCDTPAEQSLSRALNSLEAIANDDDGMSSEVLRLSSTEILMLTVLTSQGLPIHGDDWEKLIVNDNILEDDDIGADGNFQVYFYAISGVMKIAAEVWLNVASKKLDDKVRILRTIDQSDPAFQNIAEEISIMQKDLEGKKMTCRDAQQFCEDPVAFAKKSITLLEAIRKNSGPVDMNYAGEKRTRLLNKSENGLGTKVLNWFTKELSRWAHVSMI